MKALDQLIKATLLGTSRTAAESIDWPQPVHEHLHKVEKESDPERLLLQGAALMFAYQEGGKVFPSASCKVEIAADEHLPYCSKRAAQLLQRILHENHLDLIQQWLQACEQSQQLPEPKFLPDLLSLGKRHIPLRTSIQAVMGERGKWLAQMNPDWQYVLSTEAQIWEMGKPEERKYLLASLRQKDPQAALSLLQSSWKSESADLRAEFLTLLEVSLSASDLPFLEEALQDKSKKVKAIALNLLLHVKESGIANHLFQAASPMLEVKKNKSLFGLKGPSIGFHRTEMDRQLAEYGISLESLDKKFKDEEYYAYQLLELIEPARWENHFQMGTDAILQGFQKEDTLTKFIPALMQASILHQNTQWASTFAEVLQKKKVVLPKEKQYLSQEVIKALAEEEKMQYFPAHWSALSLLEYLRLCDFAWPLDFSRKAIQHLYQHYADSGMNTYERDKMAALHPYLHPNILKEKNTFLPPDHERKASWREALDLLFNALELHTSIHQAFKN